MINTNRKLPNILLIMADQLQTGAIHAYADSGAITPNMDRLAEEGVLFENCYCNSPICCASRASMVTGRYPSNIGVYDNGSELGASAPTFMHLLRHKGYKTMMSGKMHFVGPDQLHGFEERLTSDIYPADFGWTPDWSKGVNLNGGSNVQPLHNSGICKWNLQMSYDEEVHFRSLECLRNQAKRLQDEPDAPFFLCASYSHPHDPFAITREWWDLYENMDIPMPAVNIHDAGSMHQYNQWLKVHHGIDKYPLSEEEIYYSRRAYYGMVSYFDNKVGELVNELDRLGLREDTVIILTSDHGEMLGEHGMWFKRTFYDGCAKVPMIVSQPGNIASGRKTGKVVSLVDLFPTLCEISRADTELTECLGLDGSSFLTLLHEDNTDWKDKAICEYLGEGVQKPMRMLRSGSYKYVHVESLPPLLFDMENDPHETVDLHSSREFVEAAGKLHNEIVQDWDGKSLAQIIKKDQKKRILLSEALNMGRTVSWDWVTCSDVPRKYIRHNAQTEKVSSRF